MKNTERALFAAGCFWGAGHFFAGLKGVMATVVGYAGGSLDNPTYKEVCTGATGHAETVEVHFNPTEISFETLAKCFFEMHNPGGISNTAGKRSQYRSAIFYLSKAQKATADTLIETLRKKGINVRTELAPAGPFFKAEERHQNYYHQRGKTPAVRTCTPRF